MEQDRDDEVDGVLDVAALVRAAAAGDRAAWDQLVDRFSGMLWAISRSYGLGRDDAADAVQLTWLRLLERADSIQDPARVAGWLATTCRRECLGLLRRARRVTLPGELPEPQGAAAVPAADSQVLRQDVFASVWVAFAQLSDRCQRLLRLLVADVESSRPSGYRDVAELLEMPVGSLGPTRGRCLRRLREFLELEGIHGVTLDS